MTRQVLFNGAVLVRAGGATRVDTSAYQNVSIGGVGTVGLIGEADDGEPNVAYSFRDPRDMANFFRSGPLADAADLAFRPMNDTRVPGGANQVIAIKTNQSTQSTYTFTKSGADEIIVTSKQYGVHANKISVGITTSGQGRIWAIEYEDGPNAYLETSPVLGGTAEFTLKYTGTGSACSATITATALTTTVTGASGKDLNIAFNDYPTLKELINAINVAVGGSYTATAITTNPYGFICTDLDRIAAVDVMTGAGGSFYAKNFRMVDWVNTNSSWITADRAVGTGVPVSAVAATGRITAVQKAELVVGETFTLNDGGQAPTVFEFVSGGAPGSGHIAVDIAAATTAASVAALMVSAINGVTSTLLITATQVGSTAVLTLLNGVTGSQGNVAITHTVADLDFLVTGMSGGIDASAGTAGDEAPDPTTTKIPLAGGARGISTNTTWQNAFDAMGRVRVNEVVPLASQNLTNLGQGSTATWASISAMSDTHASYYSSTKGKSERQNYLGMKGTKTQVLAQAGVLQSPHTLITSQNVTRPNAAGDIVKFPEWGLAVIMAGGRAGSDLGEPLVWKNIRTSGLDQDSSWVPENDAEDLILGGVTVAFAPPNQGFKFDRVITTYTKLDNDALTEESIVMGWKAVAYDLRSQLEAIYTGTRARPATAEAIKDSMATLLEQFRQAGQIVDSVLADGSTLMAYRELRVVLDHDIARYKATVSPVAGINFQLSDLFLVPATIAA